MSHAPRWFQHLEPTDANPIAPTMGFRELRPRLPGPETRYQPRPAPTIPMFATEIRTQPPASVPPVRSYEQGDTATWNNPEPEKRAAHLTRARRGTKKRGAA